MKMQEPRPKLECSVGVTMVGGAVTHGGALVDTALKLKPDIVVADINMPQLNGLDACRSIP